MTSTTLLVSVRRARVSRGLLAFGALAVVLALPAFAAKTPKAERRDMKKEDLGAAPAGRAAPEDPQARMLGKLREQLEVTDDTEWDVIAERVTKVNDLKRTVASTASARGGPAGGDKIKRSGKAEAFGHGEQDALRSAVRDKLPDAEIKARLARVHDVHRQNEAKLHKAQEELRAVLSVRQEAVAVMAGLLPP